ncbi:hypothetical protein HDF26_001099 [Pedobacter cryoconitis]|uniref:DUF3667 domain-containing protein n=1 Tax=Pedobacter cryoconitis TaxID=188932 RepID=UPI001613094C|nr:DUF3667 domain-containing protein [Pedobacter cryoconitis]MBB6270672.1 hypothetical protein [Pedobacter cryoconitis]
MEHHCLNCTYQVIDNYCQNCGQKSSTHRYSVKHFVEHDFIHGVWHVDKGILFTIKELFTRPGNSVREFIQGKRVNYFSFVTLILLVVTASSLLPPYIHIKLSDLIPLSSKAAMNSFEKFLITYPKLIIIITIPVNSLFSLLWFRKSRINYAENLVLNSYKAASELLIGLLFTVFAVLCTDTKAIISIYFWLIVPSIFIYGIWYYYQFYSVYGYSKKALIFRSILVILSYSLLQVVIGFIWGFLQLILH